MCYVLCVMCYVLCIMYYYTVSRYLERRIVPLAANLARDTIDKASKVTSKVSILAHIGWEIDRKGLWYIFQI